MPELSIIIPTLNEERAIAEVIEKIRAEPGCEIIVVDGGSHDATLSHASKADQVITSQPGRAQQMNAGAAHATGNQLLFLHADCWPSPGFSAAIQASLVNTSVIAGGFQQCIDHPARKYRWLEAGNAKRVTTLGWVYGDQGLFLRKETFESLGGFPIMSLMEDLYFSKALKRHGSIVLLDHTLHVSPRRWVQNGVINQTLRNWAFVVMSHSGISPVTLAKWYRHIR